MNYWCSGNGKVVHVLNEVPCHEDIWGSGGIAPLILNLSTRCRWVVDLMSQPLYPLGKDPSVLTRQEDGWAPGPVWTLWQRQNILSLPVIEPWSSSLQH